MTTQHITASPKSKSILIIIPGSVSYFYDAEGRRIAEALMNLGYQVDVETLYTYSDKDYEWCFLLNLWEITFAYGYATDKVLTHIKHIKTLCRYVAMVLLESVEMKWFRDSFEIFQQANLEILIDIGLHNQCHTATPQVQQVYHFLTNGLTQSEIKLTNQYKSLPANRPIPWAFVGHMTPIRLDFLASLMQNLEPTGFVYLVHFSPVTESGPHLNESQLNTVLQKTKLQIWCTHHQFFYIESIRFRTSALTGALPIKVDLMDHQYDQVYPFHYLIMPSTNLTTYLSDLDIEETWQRFIKDYQALPSLKSEFQRFFEGWYAK